MLTTNELKSILSNLTLSEKVGMLHGDGIFETKGIKRLGIPDLVTSDGPRGVRREYIRGTWQDREWSDDSVTYFPANTALAATWNHELAFEFGDALGAEARSRGKDVILAPGVNLMRSPLCGRNFEYMSEDPALSGALGCKVVQGIQQNDVAACVKHFAANNQETNRMFVNAIVDKRTLEELYLPAFRETLVDGNAYSVMAAYNQLNGDFCCESQNLLTDVLKNQWGYNGVVISDWGGVHSTIKAAKAGLDIEMGVTTDFDRYFFADALETAVLEGQLDESILDEKVLGILQLMNQTHMLSGQRQKGKRNTPEHQLLTKKIAEEAIVLLENKEDFLPLSIDQYKKILVVGENAIKTHASGGGSAEIKALYEHSPFAGISMYVGGNTKLSFVPGYSSDKDNTPDRARDLREEALRAANVNDLVIFVGGINHSLDLEGQDRQDINLPFGQAELLETIASVNQNIVAINISGSAVDVSSMKQYAKAVLQTWYNGMESGTALANVLFGVVSPSGKLPFTIGKQLSDYSAHSIGEFPGDKTVSYSEGIYIGYRHFDAKHIEPLYCFGHGLTYSSFGYSDLNLSQIDEENNYVTVSFTLKNTGKFAAKEVVQLYVSYLDQSAHRPPNELRAFRKIYMNAGDQTQVNLTLNKRAFMSYDLALNQWVLHKERFKISAGSSSRDLRLAAEIHLV